MYCDPSSTCVPVFILEKLGLKLPTRDILVLRDLWFDPSNIPSECFEYNASHCVLLDLNVVLCLSL